MSAFRWQENKYLDTIFDVNGENDEWFNYLRDPNKETYEKKEFNTFVADPENDYYPKNPMKEYLQDTSKKLADALYEISEDSKWYIIVNANLAELSLLLSNHNMNIWVLDHKFGVIQDYLRKFTIEQCNAGKMPDDGDFKRGRVWYAAHLTACTKDKLVDEEGLVSAFRGIKKRVEAVWEILEEEKREKSDFVKGFNREVELFRSANYQKRLLIAANNIYYDEYKVLQQQNIQLKMELQDTGNADDGQNSEEANDEAPLEQQEIHDNNIVESQHSESRTVDPLAPDVVYRLFDDKSYIVDCYDIDDSLYGRLYPIYSSDPAKQNFARGKYALDAKQRTQELTDLQVNRVYPSRKPVEHWICNDSGDKDENAIPPEVCPLVLPSPSKKRSREEDDEDEVVRKRVRAGSSVISSNLTPKRMFVLPRSETSSETASWVDPGHFGYDGVYYDPSGKLQEQTDPASSVASNHPTPDTSYAQGNSNGSPPPLPQTPNQHIGLPRYRIPSQLRSSRRQRTASSRQQSASSGTSPHQQTPSPPSRVV